MALCGMSLCFFFLGGLGRASAQLGRATKAAPRLLSTGLPSNLALGQDVLLSSTATYSTDGGTRTGSASYLNDGSQDTRFFAGPGCAETTAMPDAWARIDFGREVPIALLRIWTRSDSQVPGLQPIELYVGNIKETWRDNLLCNGKVVLDRTTPTAAYCVAQGQYLWIVLRTQGAFVKPLSLCEVEVTAQGPAGTMHSLQTVGVMFNFQLDGIALDSGDRIRIVDNKILCGQAGASVMDPAVLSITAPIGAASVGTWTKERWDYVQIDRMGLYKVCWCSGPKICRTDDDFHLHVATIVVNGIIMTAAGTGYLPNSSLQVTSNSSALTTPLNEPYGVAVSGSRLYVSERSGHRVRYMDLQTGTMSVLAGFWVGQPSADGVAAKDSALWYPLGLGLSIDQRTLYIADSGSHRIRMVRVDSARPENNPIITVAGNGFRGFSGDGGRAVEAQLNQPSCVAEDVNGFLWICDAGNNRIRVVSLVLKVQVPGTNQFKSGVILTAAGDGQDGLLGFPGDGATADQAQVGLPLALTVSDQYVDPDVGRLPTNVYFTEGRTHVVRTIAVNYQDYLGVVNTVAGSRVEGNAKISEGDPQAALRAQLDSPAGISTDKSTGIVYVSDTNNHRILMLPTLEYVSLGCWRENVENPWIPSIEGEAGDPYLDGTPEGRTDAIKKCALATLLRGNLVFAVRLMGTCATSADAQLWYRSEGASTSCSHGLGGAKDNSVYRFARPGSMVEQLGMIYALAGRDGIAGFAGDRGSAWGAQLSRPTGLSVNPLTNDLWIADSGNQRIRMVFTQVGPNDNHRVFCTNGFVCQVTIFGNGLQPNNRLAVMPLSQRCGEASVAQFQQGLQRNPVVEDPSASFTTKTYTFGRLNLVQTGTFRLCFCVKDAVVYGVKTDCSDPGSYIQDAGILIIRGADNNVDTPVVARAGRPFDLALVGTELSDFDRVRIRPLGAACGSVGSANTSEAVMNMSLVGGARSYGSQNVSLWSGIALNTLGSYSVCWCKGAGDSFEKLPCNTDPEFLLAVATVIILGPTFETKHILMGAVQTIVINGGGLSAGNRIRIVDSVVTCGEPATVNFTTALDPSAIVPYGAPDFVGTNQIVWSGVKLRMTGVLTVCWCGAEDGCAFAPDFNIRAQVLVVDGPITEPTQFLNAPNNTIFALNIMGRGFTGKERVTIVDQYTNCGGVYASLSTLEIPKARVPVGNPFTWSYTNVRWEGLLIRSKGLYRVCMCTCVSTACCTSGYDFFVEAAILVVGPFSDDEFAQVYMPATFDPALYPVQTKMEVPAPTPWTKVPQDLLVTLTLNVKTRSLPAHAGSKGPILVRVYTPGMDYFPEGFQLTNLATGMLQNFSATMILDNDMIPQGLDVQTMTADAWFCEYMDLSIKWVSPRNADTFVQFGSNRFPCNSWATFPSQRADRIPRRLTDGSGDLPSQAKILPEPTVAAWEQRFFEPEACGGCPAGFRCDEELTTSQDELKMLLSSMGSLVPTGHRAVCKPICGDGLALASEQCDDGNTMSFDGCSGDCQVEPGFECANFQNMTSKCFPRLCASVEGRTLRYNRTLYALADSLGYFVAADSAQDMPLPPNKAYVCYPWNFSYTCPLDRDKLYYSNTTENLQNFQFSSNVSARVDVDPFRMDYLGANLTCPSSDAYFAPLGRDGYGSYSACAEQCSMDSRCHSVTFNIQQLTGGKECPKGFTPQRCGARCRLMEAQCSNPTATPAQAKISPSSDAFHVGNKVVKGAQDLGGPYFCSEIDIPHPITATESDGVISVRFDGPVDGAVGSPDSLGFLPGQAFDCLQLLSDQSYSEVGGASSSCRFLLADLMEIQLGPLATVNRPLGFNSLGQTFGDAAVLQFDSRKLRPRGITKDYWALETPRVLNVAIHTTRPLAVRGGDRASPPEIVIQGPRTFGGCGPLKLTADTSSRGGGRRWRSVTWTCVETRALNDTMLPLTKTEVAEALNACAPPRGRIYKILQERPWCGLDGAQSDPSGVLRPCELRVVIPPEVWCGLGYVRFRAELTTASGLVGAAEWETDIRIRSRVPTAAPIGPSEVSVSPQGDPGAPLPRLKLEVSTETDSAMMGKCTCRLTAPPAVDTSEAKVAVSWFYGQVRNGAKPMFYDMVKVPIDESDNANMLIVPLSGDVLQPGTTWVFAARAAYAVRQKTEAVLVPFTVRVGNIEPPKVVLRAPSRVNQDLCSFIVDASETQIRELLYWADGPFQRRLQSSDTADFTRSANTSGSTLAKQQALTFSWSVFQLSLGVDDSQALPPAIPGDAIVAIKRATTPYIEVPQRALPKGLYIFTVRVADVAFPSAIGEANITVKVDNEERPTFLEKGPAQVLGPTADTGVRFVQYGFGSCPTPFLIANVASGRILLMRGVQGDQPDKMEAVAELPVKQSYQTVGTYPRAMNFAAAVDRKLLRPGFVYRYKLLTTSLAHEQMGKYIQGALYAGRHQTPLLAGRTFAREPLSVPDWVWVDDGLPFTVVRGPSAGSLDVLEPFAGVGYSMYDTFTFQQLWATDAPPLEYSYFYARVPDNMQATFDAYRVMGFTDAGTNARLSSLVDGQSWVSLSDWSRDPTLVTPLPTGLYVVGSKVRDANGVNDTRLAAVKVLNPWEDNLLTANDKVNQLIKYIGQSTQVILQVQGANRGAAAVVPVTAAVRQLPDLRQFDFETMLSYYNNSGLPNPMWSQSIYGTPLVSTEVRALVIGYLQEVMDVLGDIIDTLDDQAIQGSSSRRLAAEVAAQTPSHVEALAGALRDLAFSVGPVVEVNLSVQLAQLVLRLLVRIRRARFDIRREMQAAQDLLQVEATLMQEMSPANIPRYGKIQVNSSEDIQVRLSACIIQGIEGLGDALAGYQPFDSPAQLVAKVAPQDQSFVAAGNLKLTVLVRSLNSVKTSGVSILPEFQEIDRWAYPRVQIDALGEPGFLGKNWASQDTAADAAARYKLAECYMPPEAESIFDRIVVLLIQWPSSPVVYATGSLISSSANVTMAYTVQLRSCGQQLDIGARDGDLPGKVRLTFRLDPVMVRDRRWGYNDLVPYRVAWWEDIPGIGTSADRIRRWTTLGCLTDWQTSQEDVVGGRCDRLPEPGAGSIFAVELVERPPYVVAQLPFKNKSIHDLATYFVCLLVLRWWYLWFMAQRRDEKFWPAEQDLIKIVFVPAEHLWKERVRKGLATHRRERVRWFSRRHWKRMRANAIKGLQRLVGALKTLGGSELFSSLEVRELQCMRSGRRGAVYQHFVEALDDREHAHKIAVHTFAQVEQAIAMPPSPAPRRAWPEALKLADLPQAPALQEPEPPQPPPVSLSAMLAAPSPLPDADPPAAAYEELDQIAVLRRAVQDLVVSPSQFSEAAYAQAQPQNQRYAAVGMPLPEGWTEYVSAEHGGKVYYCNLATGDTTWDRPFEMPDGTIEYQPRSPPPEVADEHMQMTDGFGGYKPRGHKLGTLRTSAQATRDPYDVVAPLRQASTRQRTASHNAAPPPAEDFFMEPGDEEQEVPLVHKLQAEAWHLALDPVHSPPEPPPGQQADSADSLRLMVHRALQAAEYSQEVVLPSGWELHTLADGREFYVNLRAGLTQWEVPKLPPHWEERLARDGKVYYLSLFDGRTQWEWPSESPETRLMLALPGSTMTTSLPNVHDDAASDTTWDTAVGAADQLDAEALLAMVPGGAATPSTAGPSTPREKKVTKPAEDEKWGISKKHEDWQDIKKQLQLQKAAHDQRYATAKRVPGVREFIRPHEMGDIVNNWDKALDNATGHVDRLERKVRALGHRAELDKEDLRAVFPVIQRLQWTKWEAIEIFVYSLMQAMPSQHIYLNLHRPTKTHRCLLNILAQALLFLGSCLMLLFKAPVNEDVTALDQSVWKLIGDFFTAPFQAEILLVMLIAGVAASVLRATMAMVFFSYQAPGDQPPFSSMEARKEQLRFWHELSDMGKWLGIACIILAVGGGVTACATMPQPRSIGVVRSFLLVCLWTHLVFPMIKASGRTFILTAARSGRAMDGLLNVFPGLMDFLNVGVMTPEFLAWRVQKIVAEEELLRRVYEAADGKGKSIDDLIQEELAMEAEHFRRALEDQQDSPTFALQDRYN